MQHVVCGQGREYEFLWPSAELLSLLNELMMPNTGSCWEQRGLLSCHCRAFVRRTHLAIMSQSQLAMVPRPSAECWKEAASFSQTSPYPALLPNLICTVGFGDGTFCLREAHPRDLCKRVGSRKSGPLCLYCFARSFTLGGVVGWGAWAEATGLMPGRPPMGLSWSKRPVTRHL